jgi:hypothetical protein
MAIDRKVLKALHEVQEQLDWMTQCGGTLLRYIERYGRADVAVFSSSSLDFPEDWTSNPDTIALARKIRGLE